MPGEPRLPVEAKTSACLTLYLGKAPPATAICLEQPVLAQILAPPAQMKTLTAALPDPVKAAAIIKQLIHQINF